MLTPKLEPSRLPCIIESRSDFTACLWPFLLASFVPQINQTLIARLPESAAQGFGKKRRNQLGAGKFSTHISYELRHEIQVFALEPNAETGGEIAIENLRRQVR
jgi:hypothetical protein